MSRNTKNANVKKPYCKVCHDAGKPESEYTSHWVKDLTGKTTCPTLLDTECRYCHGFGHTAKFCDVLAKNNKEKERAVRRAQVVDKKPAVIQKVQVMKGGFSALCDDSDTEDVQDFAVKEEPVLPIKEVPVLPIKQEPVLTGWAAIVAKPKEEVKAPVQALNSGMVVLTAKSKREPIKETVMSRPAPWATKQPVATKKWADYSDSEDEEEEEYVCNDAWD